MADSIMKPTTYSDKIKYSTGFVVNENGILEKATLTPLEKVVIVIDRRACSQISICSNS